MPVIKELDRTVLVTTGPTKVIGDGVGRTIVSVQSIARINSVPNITNLLANQGKEVVESAKIILCQGQQSGSLEWFNPIITILSTDDWVVVDKVPLEYSCMAWRVQVEDVIESKRVTYFVSSCHNGVGVVPTEVDWIIYGKIGFGNLVVSVRVGIVEIDTTKMLGLSVEAQSGLSVKVWRLHL